MNKTEQVRPKETRLFLLFIFFSASFNRSAWKFTGLFVKELQI